MGRCERRNARARSKPRCHPSWFHWEPATARFPFRDALRKLRADGALQRSHPPRIRPDEIRREAARGAPGFFRAAPDANGRWWLLDAHDRPFFCKAVHHVRATPADVAA